MELTFETPHGQETREVENPKSFLIEGHNRVCIAELVDDDRSCVFLQYGTTFELLAIHKNRNRARIYAQHAVESYHGKEGVV